MSSVLNAARVLEPPNPKTRSVEQNTHMVSNLSQGVIALLMPALLAMWINLQV